MMLPTVFFVKIALKLRVIKFFLSNFTAIYEAKLAGNISAVNLTFFLTVYGGINHKES